MKRWWSLLVTLSLFVSTLHAITLTVIVKGLQNKKGKLQVSLYNKEKSIPDKNLTKYYKTKRVAIAGDVVRIVFENLSKGRYAVSVFHDENDNHKVDKGWFMPKEGIGLSNFDTINLFRLPSFSNACFELDHDKEIVVSLIYL